MDKARRRCGPSRPRCDDADWKRLISLVDESLPKEKDYEESERLGAHRLKGARALGQETAARKGGVRQRVVERIVEREEVAELAGKRRLHLGAEEFFLISRPRLLAPTVERVQRGAVAIRAVVHAAVPGVGVNHDDRAGG